MKKRIVAVFMSVLLFLQLCPTAVYASLFDNSVQYNSEIISKFREIGADEATAEEMYSIMQKYNLLDEDGNAIEKWSITMDGKEVTLDDIRRELSGSYDPDKVVTVDGENVTLEKIAQIIEIESYVSMYRNAELYGSEWTPEHEKTYESLVKQLSTKGFNFTNLPQEKKTGDFSGMNHSAKVFVDIEYTDGGAEITAFLTGANEGQTVTFNYQVFSGSAAVTAEEPAGSISLVPDENGSASEVISVSISNSLSYNVYSSSETVGFVKLDGLKNALFENGRDSCLLTLDYTGNIDEFLSKKDLDRFYTPKPPAYYEYTLTTDEKNAICSGNLDCFAAFTELSPAETCKKYGSLFMKNCKFKVTLHNCDYYPSQIEGLDDIYKIPELFPAISTLDFNFAVELDGDPEDEEYMNYLNSVLTGTFDAKFPKFTRDKLTVFVSGDYPTPERLSLVLMNGYAPGIESVSAPEGTYTSGMQVPIVVKYTKPVQVDGASITVNGSKLTPCETGEAGTASTALSYVYTVKTVDSTKLNITAASGKALNDKEMTAYTGTVSGADISAPVKTDAIENITTSVERTAPGMATITVTAALSDDEAVTNWLISDIDGDFVSSTISVGITGQEEKIHLSADGETITGGTLSAKVTVPVEEKEKTYTAELYFGDELYFPMIAFATVSPPLFITEEDFEECSTVVKSSDGGVYTYEDEEHPVIFVQDSPMVKAFFILTDKSFEYGDTSKTTVYGADGKPVDPSADFVWESSDTSIAAIAADGTVTPTGRAGKVFFTVTALNGGAEGKSVSVKTDEIEFGAGLTPFLLIPNNNFSCTNGMDFLLCWSSNICDKEDWDSEYTVTVTRGENPVWQSGCEENSMLIPADVIEYDYTGTKTNVFTLTVKTDYLENEYSASATVTVVSEPAKIEFLPLDSYYVVDTCGKIPVKWSIESFDMFTKDAGEELFEFYITKNDGDFFRDTENPGRLAEDVYEGTYLFTPDDVKASADDSQSYRDIYTVTVKAKNGADSTWSSDSFVLYVYDDDALKILVDGAETADEITLTNVPEISKLSRDELMSLGRDIYVKAILSANYGEYEWKELADKLSWSNSENDTADLMYKQYDEYATLDDYSFTSYRPSSDFLLSGAQDGQTVVSVTHVATGITRQKTVNVETLKDKLYFLQFVPMTQVTVKYTNGNGETFITESDENGKLVIYEDSGIKGNIYCFTPGEKNKYCQNFNADVLLTGERDSSQYELYPCNNIRLVNATGTDIYLKNSDGTPYSGDVIVRCGAYYKDKYRADTVFAFDDNEAADKRGDTDNRISVGNDGKLTLYADMTKTAESEESFEYTDCSYSVLIYPQNDGLKLYPYLLNITKDTGVGTFDEKLQSIVTFRENKAEGKNPFILETYQTLTNAETGESVKASILDETGEFGISADFNKCVIHAAALWWGDESASSEENSIALSTKEYGDFNEKCYVQSNSVYPFAGELISVFTLTFDREAAELIGMPHNTGTDVYLKYMDGDKCCQTENLPGRLTDVSDVSIDDNTEIEKTIHASESFIATDAENLECKPLSFSTYAVEKMLELLSEREYSTERSGLVDARVLPTKNPTQYYVFLTAGLSTMSENNVHGIYANSTSDLYYSFYPGWKELKGVVTHSWKNYKSYYNREFQDTLEGKADVCPEINVRGYLELLVTFNTEENCWSSEILDGGFNAGGGVTLTWNFNYPPFTFTIRGGGSAEVNMEALTADYYFPGLNISKTTNEYLTKLRIFLYIYLFGGLGFDVTIAAFKLGIFGQLSFDFEFDWLNRPIYKDYEGSELIPVANQDSGFGDYMHHGQQIRIDGQLGLEFVARFLFFRVEKVIISISIPDTANFSFNDYDDIQKYWKNSTDRFRKKVNNDTAGLTSSSGSPENGLMQVSLAPTADSFSYLENGETTWSKNTLKQPLLKGLLSSSDEDKPKTLSDNAYPFSNPEFSDDGSIMVFGTDSEAENTTVSRTAYAVRTSRGYDNMGVIDNGGFGDAGHSIAGTRDFAVCAWSRAEQDIQKDNGAVLTQTDRAVMEDSSEIYASVWKNGEWTTEKLTDNSSTDASPVVAVKGDRAVIMWRSLDSDNTDIDSANFNTKDLILYRTYENGVWSEAKCLYNGTSGAVKGLNAAMLCDGTAAAAYALDKDSDKSTTGDVEIEYAVISPDGEVTRTVRATNNEIDDDNPQITSVTFNGDEGEQERFVLAWYTYNEEPADGLYSDVNFVDFAADGIITDKMPQSLKSVNEDAAGSLTYGIRFAKNCKSIDELSLVWINRTAPVATSTDNSQTERGTVDGLRAVKFFTDENNGIGSTGMLNITDIEEGTSIDSFCSFADESDSNRLVSVIQTSRNGEMKERRVVTEDGQEITVNLPEIMTDMLTLDSTYKDTFTVDNIYTDPSSFICGNNTDVMFTLTNRGLNPLKNIRITLSGKTTEFSDIVIPSGKSANLYVDYSVPKDTAVNEEYTVTAQADGGDSLEVTGLARFAISDIAITNAEIVKEENGKRTASVCLYNNSAAKLKNSGKTVQIDFYSDPNHQTKLSGTDSIIIDSESDLELIDNGAYSVQKEIDIAEYLRTQTEEEYKEIPDGGVPVYIKATMYEKDEKGEAFESFDMNPYNNAASVKCVSLAEREGCDVSVENTVRHLDGKTAVDVSIRNNKLSEIVSGNLIVSLLDSDGNVIAQKQSYDSEAENSGLITLSGEERKKYSFEFDEECADVRIDYSDLVLDDEDNAELVLFSLLECPSVTAESFTEDSNNPGTYRAEITTDVKELTAVLSAASPECSIKLNGEKVDGYTVLDASGEKDVFDISVTSANGKNVKHYILTVNDESGGNNDKKYEPCTHWVSKVCKLYNLFIDIPVLNVIFYFVHSIIHIFK